MPRTRTQIVASHFHAPSALARRLFYVVLRAGFIRCDPTYRISRPRYPGYDLLVCVGGGGVVTVEGQRHAVAMGQVAWLDGSVPHGHEPDQRDPWTLLWARVDGALVADMARALAVRDEPVFTPPAPVVEEIVCACRRVLDLMATRAVDLEPRAHAEIAVIVSHLFAVRQAAGPLPRDGRGAGIARVLARLSTDYRRTFPSGDLARLAGMSPAHFFRRFRETTGATPHDWLRRERLRQAQRLLIETDDSVQEIAFAVGYRDAFHFSRDFKRHVGVPPTAYRRAEGRALG